MNIDNPTFFIGYDSKEDIAYRVCKQSLQKKSSIKINVIALKLYELVVRNFISITWERTDSDSITSPIRIFSSGCAVSKSSSDSLNNIFIILTILYRK